MIKKFVYFFDMPFLRFFNIGRFKKQEMTSKEIFTIPNILSFFRILIIPAFVWAYFAGFVYLSAGFVALSALTDVVDGFIARKFNMVSALGKALDPIADKLTLLALLICLCFASNIILYLLIIFIAKEIAIGIEGLIIIKCTGTTYSARWYGKITTALLYLTAVAHIVWTDIPYVWSLVFLIACISLIVLSFILYTVMNVKVIKANKQNLKKPYFKRNDSNTADSQEPQTDCTASQTTCEVVTSPNDQVSSETV